MATELPGLDYLTSGFDALKMIGNNEEPTSSDRSKFRLFDLHDRDGEDFVLKILNKTQRFKTPSVVQITSINMRSIVSVESVSYNYREFYQSYFHSYSFDLSIPLDIFDVPLGYHKKLKEAYQAINEKQDAIAISRNWLGLFSTQLAPTYILKFDSIFNRSLSKLVVNPTTDTEQMYYNQLILTFGTHYISSIIIGGILSISLGAGAEFTINAREFLKNSQTDLKFSPIVKTMPETENKTWNLWLKQVSNTPVVVNRTLLSLANLLIEYPIDYYLKDGNVPTLSQLSIVGDEHRKCALTNTDILPGLDVVGCDYDIFSLKSKSCLLDLTMHDNTTWSDVLCNNFKTYRVPDGFFL